MNKDLVDTYGLEIVKGRNFLNDFVKLVLFSFVLVSPFTYLGITKWLEGYAYRIDFFFQNSCFCPFNFFKPFIELGLRYW